MSIEAPIESSENRFDLLSIITPLVNERVDKRMETYVTKQYLDLKLTEMEKHLDLKLSGLQMKLSELQIESAKMENRLMTRLGGLMAVLIGLAVAVIKLTPNVPVPVAFYAPPQVEIPVSAAPPATAPPAPSLQTTR